MVKEAHICLFFAKDKGISMATGENKRRNKERISIVRPIQPQVQNLIRVQ